MRRSPGKSGEVISARSRSSNDRHVQRPWCWASTAICGALRQLIQSSPARSALAMRRPRRDHAAVSDDSATCDSLNRRLNLSTCSGIVRDWRYRLRTLLYSLRACHPSRRNSYTIRGGSARWSGLWPYLAEADSDILHVARRRRRVPERAVDEMLPGQRRLDPWLLLELAAFERCVHLALGDVCEAHRLRQARCCRLCGKRSVEGELRCGADMIRWMIMASIRLRTRRSTCVRPAASDRGRACASCRAPRPRGRALARNDLKQIVVLLARFRRGHVAWR